MAQLLVTVAGLVVAALLSPGPNFVLISARGLSSGTKPAVGAAVGVSAGSLTHALFGIAGFGALLQSSTTAFAIAKFIGATYLIWIGFKSLRGAIRSRFAKPHGAIPEVSQLAAPVSVRRSVVDGYLTQMSNPKSTLFFLAMFTTVVPADTNMVEGAAVIATVVAIALIGYVLIAVVFSRPVLQRGYKRVGFAFDAVFGVLMIALGLKVASTQQ